MKRSGHRDRPAVRSGGAFDRRRREDACELVLAIGDQPRKVEILVVVDAVHADQLAVHRDGEVIVRVGHHLGRLLVDALR